MSGAGGEPIVVERLLPEPGPVDAASVVNEVRAAGRDLRPFDERVVAFTGDLSRRLRRDPDCRRLPAVAALAFWIRPAAIERLRTDWAAGAGRDDHIMVVPRGVVFHLPPTNVDTLFVYSWLLSALAGNANVIRLSNSADAGPLLQVIGDALAHHPEIAAATCIVRYGHETDVTAALSTADVRVVWGGDETVRAIRAVPMSPLATELTFADRFSMAVFRAGAMNRLDDDEHAETVRRFYNDSFWFDQLGCSSPRLVFWTGDDEACAAAEARFAAALRQRVVDEGYRTPTGAAMNKLTTAAAMAADGHATTVSWPDPEVTIVEQPAEAPVVRDSPGGGLFAFRRIRRVTDLAEHVTRRDQTLTHYGFERDELAALADRLNGVGIDRMVPVGRALEFDRFWDGWDLLDAFTRRVGITT